MNKSKKSELNLGDYGLMDRKERRKFIFKEVQRFINKFDGEQDDENVIKKSIEFAEEIEVLMFFSSQISMMHSLSISECGLIFEIISKYVGDENEVFLSSDDKKKIGEDLGLDPSAISKALKSFREKEIFSKKSGSAVDVLNPYIFGNGKWKEKKMITQKISFEYDFLKKCASQTQSVSATYMEKRKDENETVISRDVELEILKEENKKLELKYKILELQVKNNGKDGA